jgi:hypothetical protein
MHLEAWKIARFVALQTLSAQSSVFLQRWEVIQDAAFKQKLAKDVMPKIRWWATHFTSGHRTLGIRMRGH